MGNEREKKVECYPFPPRPTTSWHYGNPYSSESPSSIRSYLMLSPMRKWKWKDKRPLSIFSFVARQLFVGQINYDLWSTFDFFIYWICSSVKFTHISCNLCCGSNFNIYLLRQGTSLWTENDDRKSFSNSWRKLEKFGNFFFLNITTIFCHKLVCFRKRSEGNRST